MHHVFYVKNTVTIYFLDLFEILIFIIFVKITKIEKL